MMRSSGAIFLNVKRSLGGNVWIDRDGDELIGLAIAQRFGLPEIMGRILSKRGIGLNGAEEFLRPTLRMSLPDPNSFCDMEKAAVRLADAVIKGERVAIFGDYDVDGATSSALLLRWLRWFGLSPMLFIPDRLRDGYGPNSSALLGLQAQGASLVITVDCGTVAHEPLRNARKAGLDVIVCDHHMGDIVLPEAFAVVNPNRLDEKTPHRTLAAVGMAFLLVIAANRTLRQHGWFKNGRHQEPNLLQLLDLVALGTVCDVVPLIGLNRAFVTQGIKVMRGQHLVWLTALADIAGIDGPLTSYHLSHALGPRINAGGRIGRSDLGARLLSSENPAEAKEIAAELNRLNTERQQLEAKAVSEAITAFENEDSLDPNLIFAVGKDWHPGIIGIVASRLKERFARPAFAVSLFGGKARGSGRSVKGIVLGEALLAAKQAGHIEHGGGHAMAAGFTARVEQLPLLRQFLANHIAANSTSDSLQPKLLVDGAITINGCNNAAFLADIERLAPYGAGHPEPCFVITPVWVEHTNIVGKGHIRCFLSSTPVPGKMHPRLKAIAFRALDTPLGQRLIEHKRQALHIAGNLRSDPWGGRDAVQLIIADAAEITYHN